MERSPNLLDEALGFNHQFSGSSLRGRAVFIEDCLETSGSFVLHHLIKHFLSLHSSGGVVFVAFAQPLSHYERILRKLVRLSPYKISACMEHIIASLCFCFEWFSLCSPQ